MKKSSLVYAKTHLSEIVDQAEHDGVSTMILRHGKPSAVIVPLSAVAPRKARPHMTPEEIAVLYAELESQGDPTFEAVQDILDGRR